MTDAAGKDVEFKIQPQGEPGVPLSGTQAVINFPAQVTIRGAVKPEALTQGSLIRFSGKLNRVGRTDGEVGQIALLDEKSQELGLKVDREPAERGGFADCTLVAEVFSCRDNRLVVNTPTSDYVPRSPRLSFKLNPNASISGVDEMQSKPGQRPAVDDPRSS